MKWKAQILNQDYLFSHRKCGQSFDGTVANVTLTFWPHPANTPGEGQLKEVSLASQGKFQMWLPKICAHLWATPQQNNLLDD